MLCGHTVAVAAFVDSTEKQFKVESGKLPSLLCCLHSFTAWNDFDLASCDCQKRIK